METETVTLSFGHCVFPSAELDKEAENDQKCEGVPESTICIIIKLCAPVSQIIYLSIA